MKNESIYKSQARYYDLIYFWKDYKAESAKILSIIKKYKQSKGVQMLEVACGTGKHAKYLTEDFNILATDLNEDMLKIAKKEVKGPKFLQADMLTLDLNKKFDVILCLFSSIGYLKNYKNLEKAIGNFANHLTKDGVLIIEPWFTKENFVDNLVKMDAYDGPELKIARISNSKSKNLLSIVDMNYLIGETHKPIKSFRERHELAMFKYDKFAEFYKKAGLKCVISKIGLAKNKVLIIGVKK